MKRLSQKLTFIFLVAAFLSGCSPSDRTQASKATTTAEFPRPKVMKEEGFKIARGATRIDEMNVIFDPTTKGMKLKGKIEYIPTAGQSLRNIEVDLSGVEDGKGFIFLRPSAQTTFANGEKVGAKATCLGENNSCSDSFVDIYIYIDGIIYHHQVESHQGSNQEDKDNFHSTKKDDELKGDSNQIPDKEQEGDQAQDQNKQDLNNKKDDLGKKENPSKNQDPSKKKDSSKKQDSKKNVPESEKKDSKKNSDVAGPEDESESEGDLDSAGDSGEYVGTLKEDIQTLFQLQPEEDKTESPKKDADNEDSTLEEPQKSKSKEKEPSKNEPPKKDVPKKGEPKADAPKKGDSKKDEPKKDDSKNQDQKKQEPKKDEPKKDEPVKETPNKDEAQNVGSNINLSLSQAIGSVNAGRLENAADFLRYAKKYDPAGFFILRPERKTYFATNELLYVVAKMGQATLQNLPGYSLALGDLAHEKGGRLGSHRSHQNGLDGDIGYYFNTKALEGTFTSAVVGNKPHPNWMYEEQWKLFKFAVKTKYVDRIFLHKVLKKALCNLAIEKGELEKGKNDGLAYETLRRLIADPSSHDNHFHMRVKCSKSQIRCRQMAEPAQGSGCF
ncbi:MAG: penicillin-insensitive murein endopeptidase [Pseudobdellovibrionaceae bacterium]